MYDIFTMMSKMDAVLTKLYNDPAAGFQSAQNIDKKLKPLHPEITYAKINDFLSRQESGQIHRETKRSKYHPVIAHHVKNGWQLDLIDMTKYKSINKNYK